MFDVVLSSLNYPFQFLFSWDYCWRSEWNFLFSFLSLSLFISIYEKGADFSNTPPIQIPCWSNTDASFTSIYNLKSSIDVSWPQEKLVKTWNYLHVHNYKYCHMKTMKWFHLFWQQIHRSYWIARLAESRVRAITGVQAKEEYTFLNRSPNFSVLPTTACTKQVRVIVAIKTCRKCYHLIVNHALVGHYWMKPMTENTHEIEACVTKLYISVTIKGVRTRVSEFTGVVAWSVEKIFPWLSERCDVQASFQH
jgi:hypothetical protein